MSPRNLNLKPTSMSLSTSLVPISKWTQTWETFCSCTSKSILSFLMQSHRSHPIPIFWKTFVVRRELLVPKRVFLAGNFRKIQSDSMPNKYKDSNCPTISCIIGNTIIDKALLDLGTSMNLLPYSVYKQLGVDELKATKLILQLADSPRFLNEK